MIGPCSSKVLVRDFTGLCKLQISYSPRLEKNIPECHSGALWHRYSPGGQRENVSNEVAAFIFAKELKSGSH